MIDDNVAMADSDKLNAQVIYLQFLRETPRNTFIFQINRINDSKSQARMVFAPGKQTFIKPEAQNGYRPNKGLPEQTPFSIERPPSADLGIASFDNETAV